MSTHSNPLPPAIPALARRKCLAAVALHDARMDGAFVYAVRSTGIYCRPSCPSRRPRTKQILLFIQPEAAERAGFRACQRCHPRQAQRQPASGTHSARVRRNREQLGRRCFSAEARGTHRTERRSLATHVPPGDGNYAATICGRASRGAVQIRITKGERRDYSICMKFPTAPRAGFTRSPTRNWA